MSNSRTSIPWAGNRPEARQTNNIEIAFTREYDMTESKLLHYHLLINPDEQYIIAPDKRIPIIALIDSINKLVCLFKSNVHVSCVRR